MEGEDILLKNKFKGKMQDRREEQQIKGPDPQGDGGRPESRWSASSFRMVAAAGMVHVAVVAALAVDDVSGDSLGEGAGSGSWRVLSAVESGPPCH